MRKRKFKKAAVLEKVQVLPVVEIATTPLEEVKAIGKVGMTATERAYIDRMAAISRFILPESITNPLLLNCKRK